MTEEERRRAHYYGWPVIIEKGGPGSGYFGPRPGTGRPGLVGGSQKKGVVIGPFAPRGWVEEAARGKAAVGHTTTAFGNDPNRQYELKSKVVSLDSLIPSNTDAGGINPAYPQELQPRDRSRTASRRQIDNVAKNLNSEALLVDFHQLDKGSPIAGEDGAIESGNGRLLALRRARELYPEKWREYQDSLPNHLTENGIDPADVEGIESPILIRERVSDVDRTVFSREANAPSVLQMSPLETAKQDRRLITPESLNRFTVREGQSLDESLRSAANRPFVREFVSSLPPNEQARIQRADGSLNRMGLWRMKSAMFSKTFPGEAGDRLSETFFESVHHDTKNFENGLSDVLPKMARAENLIATGQRRSDLSLADDISKSIDMFARLKEQNLSAEKYVAQRTLFERELTPRQERLLIGFERSARSRKAIRGMLERYADGVIKSPDPRQQAFAGVPLLAADDLAERMIAP